MPRGWTAAEWNAYRDSITTSTEWLLEVRILDRAHNLVAALPPSQMSGQVNIDTSQDIDRTMQLSLVDVDDRVAGLLAPDVALKHYIQVRQGTYVAALGRVLWQAIFTGIPWVTSEQGGVYEITAQGKESLWLAPSVKGQIRKGAFVLASVQNELIDRGERRRLDFPTTAEFKTRARRAVKWGGSNDIAASPWKAWKRACAAAGFHLFVDGAGYYVIRRFPSAANPVYVFDQRTILSEPKFGVDQSALRNRWLGRGAGTLAATVTAAGVFAPTSLAVGEGKVPWFSTEFADKDESLTTTAKLVAAGRARLLRLITYSSTVDVDVVPFHALAPFDVVRVDPPNKSIAIPIKAASIPFAAEASDSVGTGWPMSLGKTANVRLGRNGRVRVTGKPPKRRGKKK